MFCGSVLCQVKLDSALIRLNEEVQRYANHILQLGVIPRTNPCLEPHGILQKVSKKAQGITTVQGTVLRDS